MRESLKRLNIYNHFPYHPQSNAKVKRFHRMADRSSLVHDMGSVSCKVKRADANDLKLAEIDEWKSLEFRAKQKKNEKGNSGRI